MAVDGKAASEFAPAPARCGGELACSPNTHPWLIRVDELLEAGDMAGRRVWHRVLEAVQELTSKEPPGEGAAVH